MSIYGIYPQISDSVLEEVVSLPRQAAEDRIFDLFEVDHAPEIDIAKSWDGLHYLLTGYAAEAAPPLGLLSEAIIGEETLFESRHHPHGLHPSRS